MSTKIAYRYAKPLQVLPCKLGFFIPEKYILRRDKLFSYAAK
jgi:hypothetical protein